MSKLQLPAAYKSNSRCSSLPGVAEFPYMEGYIFICKWKLHIAFERTAWS